MASYSEKAPIGSAVLIYRSTDGSLVAVQLMLSQITVEQTGHPMFDGYYNRAYVAGPTYVKVEGELLRAEYEWDGVIPEPTQVTDGPRRLGPGDAK